MRPGSHSLRANGVIREGQMTKKKERSEYSRFEEPTVQVALRLPESLVAAIDERRGRASRATYVAIKMSEAMSARVSISGAMEADPRPAPVITASERTVCTHPHKKRGASGLLICTTCGKVVMK